MTEQLPQDQALTLEQAVAQRDEAIAMLADWCAMVDVNGTGWDDWDEGYKAAMYRPCGIRLMLDIAIKEAEKAYGPGAFDDQ